MITCALSQTDNPAVMKVSLDKLDILDSGLQEKKTLFLKSTMKEKIIILQLHSKQFSIR
jgi:hypothetical protein